MFPDAVDILLRSPAPARSDNILRLLMPPEGQGCRVSSPLRLPARQPLRAARLELNFYVPSILGHVELTHSRCRTCWSTPIIDRRRLRPRLTGALATPAMVRAGDVGATPPR